MTTEQKIQRIGERHTISLMITYLLALLGAFAVMALV
jgi:hypothetical protein